MKTSRRGVMLLEVIVAFGLLSLLVAACLQMTSITTVQRRGAERRAVAMQEAANIVERIAARPWDEITTERLADVALSSDVQKILPAGALRLTVEPTTAGPPGRRVSVEIVWTRSTGDRETPVRLTAWVYAPAGGTQP